METFHEIKPYRWTYFPSIHISSKSIWEKWSTYCQWILRYIQFFGGKIHPWKLDAKHIEKFVSHLATKGNFAASTQRQALNALVFLYRDVLNQPLSAFSFRLSALMQRLRRGY